MQSSTSELVFPLFTRFQSDENEDIYACLFRNENSSKTCSPCGHNFSSFADIIKHLELHGLTLINNRDFCLSDEIIFRSPITALEHFLTHGINIINLGLSWSSKELLENPWFQEISQKLGGIRKEVLDHIFNPKVDLDDEVDESQIV